ncbi:hypothetical protein [Streptomyces sp. NPDC000410]|uniref:hypothetical protein n=1 Tax=Streptomyces sp. NPDC000410 TaxID=3154254 RepID=UPI00332D254E
MPPTEAGGETPRTAEDQEREQERERERAQQQRTEADASTTLSSAPGETGQPTQPGNLAPGVAPGTGSREQGYATGTAPGEPGAEGEVEAAKRAKEEEARSGEISEETRDRMCLEDESRADNANLASDGRVIDENTDGDGNGVQDGIQYVEGDADLNDDGTLSDFEREYGDKDDDGKLDNRDDAEANDLEVDEDPGVDPLTDRRDTDRGDVEKLTYEGDTDTYPDES